MIDNNNKYDLLGYQASKNPSSIAIQSNKTIFTFRELNEKSLCAASNLQTKGVNSGDHIIILQKNSPDFIITLTALWKLGAIPIPVSLRLLPNQIDEILKFTQAKFIVSSDETARLVEDIPEVNVIGISELQIKRFKTKESFSTNETALIMLTSGSVARPKAVVHTFQNLLNSSNRFFSLAQNVKGKKFLSSLPFYHIGGFSIITRAIASASKIIIPDTLEHDEIENSIRKFQPSYLSIVPTTLKRFIDSNFRLPDQTEMVFVGGGPAAPELSTSAIQLGYPIFHVYGSTETFAMITSAGPEQIKKKPSTSGKALSGCEIKIIDEQGKELAYGNEGEIVVKSNSLFKEYLGDEGKNNLTNGFYRTGDIGYLDEERYLFVSRRKDSFIISGGEKINPEEVENVILKIGGIEDVFIAGIKDDYWGEIAAALIQPGENVAITSKLLNTMLREYLPSYKIPKKMKFVKKIPRNELGKINRQAAMKILTL